jgi:phage gp37-like protein
MTTPVLDPTEVQVGTANGPGIYIADEGTAGPADTTSPWASPWASLGYLDSAGPVVGQKTTSNSLTPWQSVASIRSVITGRELTLQFILWQLNAQTLALYFDTDVVTPATDGSLSMEVRSDDQPHVYALGIDSRDGEQVFRIAFTRATLTTTSDMKITRGEAIPLDCTLTAMDDNGVLGTILLGPATAGGLATAASPIPPQRGKADAS